MIEHVRSTIIGGEYRYYEFWTCELPRRIDKGYFRNDDDAEQSFKENYPDEYKFGVEMRCWD